MKYKILNKWKILTKLNENILFEPRKKFNSKILIKQMKLSSTYLPIGLSIFAIILAAISLINSFGGSLKDDLTNFSGEFNKLKDNHKQEALSINDKIKSASDRIDSLASQTLSIKRMAQNVDSQQIKKMQNDIAFLALEVKKLAEKEKQAQSASPSTSAAPTSANTQASQTQSQAASLEENQEKIHIIAAGDYFSKIAQKYGVSVVDIEKANPGLDSRKLRIGQKVNIPAKK